MTANDDIDDIDSVYFGQIFHQGRRLRGNRGIVPLKKLGGGTEVLLSPQYLENVWQIYNVKTNKNEKEDETHVTHDRHTSIIVFHCLDLHSIVAVL